MGFAVVAGEVRNLAQRSAQAAKDTASLLEESIARSQEGAGRVEEVALAIASITDNVARVKGMVEEVRQASGQQAQGIDQVTQAIAQMESVTQTTAATAEESAAASEELNAQAEQSMAVVRRLERLVNGKAASAPAGRTGRAGKRVEPAVKPSTHFHSRHDLAALGSAEAAFPLTTDVASAYMKPTPAAKADRETSRHAS